MTAVDLLAREAEIAFHDLLESLKGLTQQQAWGRVEAANSDDYLNTDGSVQGVALHVATCKKAYGSFAFRNSELRWRDIAEEVEPFEKSWEHAQDYLKKAHAYWLSTWHNLADGSLESEALHFSGKQWPVWKLIQTVIHHDQYHAGQITIVRYAAKPTDLPPPSQAEDIRTYCKDLPTW